MENKAAKKARKGILSVIFGRTALILALVLIQLYVIFMLATILHEYAFYIYGVSTVAGAAVIIYIINQRGNPAFNMTWVLLILVFPAFGCLFYLYVKSQLGTRYIGKRLGKLRIETYPYMGQNQEIIERLRKKKPADANLAHYMKYQLDFPTYQNTELQYFESGEVWFPVLLEELKKAEKFIFMEYFIVAQGKMWGAVLDVLKEKAKQGVEVRFMYDGTCSLFQLPYGYPKELNSYGIQCKIFSPIRPVLSTTQNNRDHRKICVVDGKVGFTGGLNLADEYINEIVRFGYWKDTAILLRGDGVQSLTMLFLQMWNVTETRAENYKAYRTQMRTGFEEKNGFVIPYGDSPYDNENVGEEVYFHILNHAKKYVHIMTPYLIIDNEMLDTLTHVAKTGIEVSIIMPHIPDKWYAFAVAKTFYKDLIQSGVRIYEFTPGFVHAKSFVSDDDTAVVGSINLDYRSLYLHYECGVFIYDNPVVHKVEQDFQETLRQCHLITLDDVKKINPFMMLCGRVLRLIAPLM